MAARGRVGPKVRAGAPLTARRKCRVDRGRSASAGTFWDRVDRTSGQVAILAPADQGKLEAAVAANGPREVGQILTQLGEFLGGESPEHRERPVMADQAIAGQEPAP